MEKQIIYEPLNCSTSKTFMSIDEFNNFVKKNNKLPLDGSSNWNLIEKTIVTKNVSIPVETKATFDRNIVKEIIDVFIKNATLDNVDFDYYIVEAKDERYRDCSYDTIFSYMLADHEGYPKEKVDKLFKDKKFWKDKLDYWSIQTLGWLIPWIIVSDKFNIDVKDINWKNYSFCDENSFLRNKYPEACKYIKKMENDMGCGFDEESVTHIEWNDDLVKEYKELISKYPVDKIKIRYNRGNYKPCNNYKFDFPSEFDPRGKEICGTLHKFSTIPGIMFRDEDIYVTLTNYIGRHVSHKYSEVCPLDDKLLEYCTKNLI